MERQRTDKRKCRKVLRVHSLSVEPEPRIDGHMCSRISGTPDPPRDQPQAKEDNFNQIAPVSELSTSAAERAPYFCTFASSAS